LASRPELTDEVRGILDEKIIPALGPPERPGGANVTMDARASGSGRIYQAGRDQLIIEQTER
jgi:hypothetical protein